MYERRGLVVRVLYLLVASAYWLATGVVRRGRPWVVTLYYHGVRPEQRSRFRRQMTAIADRAIAVDQITTALWARSWPPRVCVTFDDALGDLPRSALPVLRKLAVPCAIFAVADRLGRHADWTGPDRSGGAAEITMSALQLRRAARQNGVTVGSHAATHRPLTAMSARKALLELTLSRSTLERDTGGPIRDFAFPHGACDEGLIESALAAGYSRVYTLSPTPCAPAGRGGVVIGRMKMTPDAWPIEFRLTAAGAYAWLPRWRRLVGHLRLSPAVQPK